MSDQRTDLAGTRIGRYLLVERLGEGGMGTVWKARQSEPIERDVAIKLIKPGLDTAAVLDRFSAERQLLARLDHPNIAAIFDAGSTGAGLPYYVMELVDGQAITDYCKTNELPQEERLALFSEVCRTIQYAHENGVIHRDIKPSNVLVSSGGHLKIIDFGIAKSVGDDFTQHSLCTAEGQLVGTPGYMSPEQAENRRDIDGRADVYSLGALLYELLCDSPPFSKESLHGAGMLEVMRIIREEQPPRPTNPTNPTGRASDLDWIALKALAKDPTQRYGSPTALAEDIERHQSHQAVTAGPPGIHSRVAKTLRRHRATAVIAAVGLIAGCVALVLAKLSPSAPPSQFTVTTLADSGPGSLRQLITDAPSGATIRFAPDLKDGTITHRGASLTITRSLSIDAAATGMTIDAAGAADRLFVVSEASAELSLTGLTITGAGHGALHNFGAVVELRHCTFTRNLCRAGGVVIWNHAGGALLMESCLLAENQGVGVNADETSELTMLGCTIANNRANTAAALRTRTNARMVNCTVTGNVCTPPNFVPPPEGNYPFMEGGAINVGPHARLDLEHCTVVGNSSPSCGGIHLWLGAKLFFKNSIIAGNLSTHSGPPDISCVQGGTDPRTLGGNFIGNSDGISWHKAFQPDLRASLWQDQIGTREAPIDPQLAPLGDYGGPVPTMPPLPDSPVIDAVSVKREPLASDARGVKRPTGKRHDIGAVEFNPATDQ